MKTSFILLLLSFLILSNSDIVPLGDNQSSSLPNCMFSVGNICTKCNDGYERDDNGNCVSNNPSDSSIPPGLNPCGS